MLTSSAAAGATVAALSSRRQCSVNATTLFATPGTKPLTTPASGSGNGNDLATAKPISSAAAMKAASVMVASTWLMGAHPQVKTPLEDNLFPFNN